MRTLFAPLTLLAILSACSTNPAPEGVPYRSDLPLQAQIQASGTGGVSGFYVNRPAYVAIFEIHPGQGASLIYPYSGGGMSSGFVYGGTRSLPWHGSSSFSNYRGASSGALQAGPRFIYMLASEEPFDVNDFRNFAYNMRYATDLRFASYSAQSTMEDLTRALVPDVRRTNWSSDVYVYWPNTLYDRRMPEEEYVLIKCNGRPYYVHRANLTRVYRTICSTDENAPPVRIDSTAVDPETGVPTRLRPTPRTTNERPGTIWADEISQRVGEPATRIERRERIEEVRERMRPQPVRPTERAEARPERIEPPAPRPQPRAQPPRPVGPPPSRAVPVTRTRPDPVKPTSPPKKKGGGGGGESII